jgi:hypothetical protein
MSFLMFGMCLMFISMGAFMLFMWNTSFGNEQAKKVGRKAGWVALATVPVHTFIIWSLETWMK